MKATDTYAQNAGGGTAGRNKYESANNMADIGDEIREYIANLTSAAADGAAKEQAANTMGKTNQFDAMAAQIKALTDTVAKLVSKENKNPNVGGGGEKKSDRQSYGTWGRTATPTVSILLALATTARHAAIKKRSITPKPRGKIASRETCIGQQPKRLPSNNKNIPPGKGSRPPPFDRNRGIQVAKVTMLNLLK